MKFVFAMLICMMAGQLLAADKTPEELCRERNAANCEINGLKFFLTEQECPKGAKVLRKLGHENCDQYASSANSKPEQSSENETVAKDSAVNADKEQGEVFFWGTAYFILALIGLLQGMISRASVGSLIIVLLIMPVLGAWTTLSDAKLAGGVMANAGYIGMELFGNFLFSLAGWLAGAGIRRIAYRILLGQ